MNTNETHYIDLYDRFIFESGHKCLVYNLILVLEAQECLELLCYSGMDVSLKYFSGV